MKNLIRGIALLGVLSCYGCAQNLHLNPAKLGRAFSKPSGGATLVLNNGEQAAGNTKEEFSTAVHDSVVLNQPVIVSHGFAHNDYLHKRPLYDALENGFTNIEADIFLIRGKLTVAHFFPWFKGNRTLESLYLRPLLKRFAQNKGKVFAGYEGQVILMIDIKTNADKTYEALKPLLEKYKSILTSYENGKIVYRALTVALSGHKPYEMMKGEQNRRAFIDEDLRKIAEDPANGNLFTMASCKYSSLVKWNGNGVFSGVEKEKLCAFVAMAHKRNAKVRLWASPEKKEVWDELLNCGVDLINTDQLATLKNYLSTERLQVPTGEKIAARN